MLKRELVAALIAGAVALSGFGIEGLAITQVIYRPTAYTLPAGRWEITATVILPYLSLPGVGASYGLTKAIQVSTDITSDLFAIPNLNVKLAIEMLEPPTLAIPAGFTFFAAQGSLYAASWFVMSWKGLGPLGTHTGSMVFTLPSFSLSPYPALDYELVPGTVLLSEVDILPFQTRLGTLFKIFDSLFIRLWMGFPRLSLGASGAPRF